MEPKYPDLSVQLSGEDGNAFNLIGIVRRELQRAGHPTEEFVTEATAGDYDHVLQTCMAWVDVS